MLPGIGPFSSWFGPVLTRKYPPSRYVRDIEISIKVREVDMSWSEVYERENEEPIEGYMVSRRLVVAHIAYELAELLTGR